MSPFITRLLLLERRWPMDMVLVTPTMARETPCPGTFFQLPSLLSKIHCQ